MKKLVIYTEMKGLCENPNDYCGCAITQTFKKDLPNISYDEVIKSISKAAIINALNLKNTVKESDINIITKEDYDIKYGGNEE